MLGHWKNIEEMENNLCLAELEAILDASREREFRQQKFAAALKGVDLGEPDGKDVPTFDDIKNRAKAKLAGKSEEEVSLEEIGFAVETE